MNNINEKTENEDPTLCAGSHEFRVLCTRNDFDRKKHFDAIYIDVEDFPPRARKIMESDQMSDSCDTSNNVTLCDSKKTDNKINKNVIYALYFVTFILMITSAALSLLGFWTLKNDSDCIQDIRDYIFQVTIYAVTTLSICLLFIFLAFFLNKYLIYIGSFFVIFMCGYIIFNVYCIVFGSRTLSELECDDSIFWTSSIVFMCLDVLNLVLVLIGFVLANFLE